MFDSGVSGPVSGMDAAMTMALVSHAHRQVLEQECLLLSLAAHWADLNSPLSQTVTEQVLPGGEQARTLGGDGTPEVLEFAAAELGARMETTTGSARALMADALDVRHRLPQLWRMVHAGQVRVWQVRKVAQATRDLHENGAQHVDAAVAPFIGSLPWNRFVALLQAKIIEADPKAADEQAKIWEAERFVRSRSTEQSGLKLLIAKANAGNVILFMATVNRIADILRLRGDFDTADVRRSKAIGILAQPALALELLWTFRDEQRPSVEPQRPEEPVESLSDHEPDRRSGPPSPDPEPADRDLIIRPSGVDQGRLQPQVVLHVHLSQESLLASLASRSGHGCGPARMESVGPVTLGQVQRFLAHTACTVNVRPVIDSTDTPAVDEYEVPRRVREAMFLRMPASCFPFSARVGRNVDLDHTIPYRPPDRGGPPGQTAVGNLGPLSRTEHRLKTHGRWQVRQAEPGVYLWRSPTKSCYLVTSAGTHVLGDGSFAAAMWRAAVPPARPSEDYSAA